MASSSHNQQTTYVPISFITLSIARNKIILPRLPETSLVKLHAYSCRHALIQSTTSANRGGASSIPTPANSGGSSLFGGTDVGATHETKKVTSTTDDGSRRRASQGGGGMYGNLSNLKRDSQDANTANRKSSFAEQGAKPGMIGNLWNT